MSLFDKGVKPKMMWKDVITGNALAFHLLIWRPEYAYVFSGNFEITTLSSCKAYKYLWI